MSQPSPHFTATFPPCFMASTDPALLDPAAVHRYISTRSYWAIGVPLALVERGLKNSLVLGLYDTSCTPPAQIGCGRWITDYATVCPPIRSAPHGGNIDAWVVVCILERCVR